MMALKTAVKIVGVVAGVAAIATGFGAPLGAGILGATWGAIATGVALTGAVLDTLSPSRPKSGSAIGSQTEWKADPQAGIPYAIGRTAYAGNIVHRDTWGADNKYFGNVMVWSGAGPVHAFEAFQIDRTTVSFSSGAATGALAGFAWLKTQLGLCPESAALSPVNGTLPGWDSDNKLSGYCAGLFEVMFDKEGKQWAGGFPQSLLAILQGVKVYDPRLDSTYPGGSGSHRANDESTWAYSECPALHAIAWALGRHQNGERVMAVGLPASGIDLPRYVDWANVCDANNWKVGGVVSSLDDKWDVLKKICQGGAAVPVRLGGMLSVDFQAPRVSLATITKEDLAGPGQVVGTKRRRERINTGVPRLRLESHGWEVTTLDPIVVSDYVTQDGGPRSREIDLELVQDADQAAELVAYDLVNAREFGPITLPLKIEFVGYKPGDCLTLDIDELGLDEQAAIIARRNTNQQTGVITHEFVSETDAKHDFALGRTGTPPPTPSLTPIDLSNVPAPGEEAWELDAVQLTGTGGEALPALRVTGAVDNANAEAIILELREDGETDWTGMEMHAFDLTSRDVMNVRPGVDYEVAVSYIVRGVRGARRVLGPETVLGIEGIEGPAGAPGPAGDSTLNLVSFGSTDVTIAGNTIQRVSGSDDYTAVVRADPMAGACWAAMDIPLTLNTWAMLALDNDEAGADYADQLCYAGYNRTTGTLHVYEDGAVKLNTSIGANHPGKIIVRWDGEKFRIDVGGEERFSFTPASAPTKLWPKWYDYTGAGVLYTGLAASIGPYKGDTGDPGDPGISAELSLNNFSVACASNGTPISGAFDEATGKMRLLAAGVPISTGSITFSVLSTSNASGSIDSDGDYEATAITAEKGTITFRAVHAGQNYDLTLYLVKVRGGSAATSASANVPSLAGGGSFGQVAFVDLLVPNGASITANAFINYEAATGAGNPTYQAQTKLSWENTTDSGSETDFSGSTQTGTTAQYLTGDLSHTPGSVSSNGSGISNSTGAPKMFRIRLYERKNAGSGSAGSVQSGNLTVSAA